MSVHSSPLPVSLKTRLPARYTTSLPCRLATRGAFQWKRKRACPSCGCGRSSLISPFRTFVRWNEPCCDSA